MLVQIIIVLCAVVIPIVMKLCKVELSAGENLIFGASLYLCGSLLELIILVRKIDARERKSGENWELRSDVERVLHNLRHHYHEVSRGFYGPRDLYLDHIRERVQEVCDIVKRAAERKELAVTDYHFKTTELVLDAVEGDTQKILRYVWLLEDPYFDEMWLHYLRQVDKLRRGGQLATVRALLVYREEGALAVADVKKICGFFAHDDLYECRCLNRDNYDRMLKDHHVNPNEYMDFGIYGTRYVYLTQQYEPETKGVFSKDPGVIEKYQVAFDNAFKAPSARVLVAGEFEKVSLDDLLRKS